MMQARSEGTIYDQGNGGHLPDKVEGQHRWIMAVSYALSNGQIAAARAGSRVNLDHENRVAMAIGCWDCEESYDVARASPCPGDPAA